jgi:hypothetical protein
MPTERRQKQIRMLPTGNRKGIIARHGCVQTTRPDQPEFFVGVVHLGRGRQRLPNLRLEAAVVDSVPRRLRDDGHFLFCAGADHVAGQHRHHVCRLVADKAGLLTLFGIMHLTYN